ncbi:unnamed protein product [Clonostachys rosea]|uniref:Uncharacterized protein n=1 Tax=Bionectria ochroleuca TaxID=29856 RepID=A0ABY6UAH0_BIOOC|nr:unnamed protein product [Clonostachys rosea]
MPEGLAPPPTAELCPRRTSHSAPRVPTIEAPDTPYQWGQGKAMPPSAGGSGTPDVQGRASDAGSWSGSSGAVCPISAPTREVTGPRFMITCLR